MKILLSFINLDKIACCSKEKICKGKDPFNLYKKSVLNIRIMFPKSKDFDFLDVPILMSF